MIVLDYSRTDLELFLDVRSPRGGGKRFSTCVLALLLLCWPSAAQQSASYQLTETSFNEGGNPRNGTFPASASFRLTLDAIGDRHEASPSGSASFQVTGGVTAALQPPGEVMGLHFSDAWTLGWEPERSVGDYNLYRDSLAALRSETFGVCEENGIAEESTVAPNEPGPGECYFYLVTAVNRLGEEGTPGRGSDDGLRPLSNICP